MYKIAAYCREQGMRVLHLKDSKKLVDFVDPTVVAHERSSGMTSFPGHGGLVPGFAGMWRINLEGDEAFKA